MIKRFGRNCPNEIIDFFYKNNLTQNQFDEFLNIMNNVSLSDFDFIKSLDFEKDIYPNFRYEVINLVHEKMREVDHFDYIDWEDCRSYFWQEFDDLENEITDKTLERFKNTKK